MSKLICPVCRGKEFTEYKSNGATVEVCNKCHSCYRVENKSWFHFGEVKK